MTPEELESRMKDLLVPDPPDRIRERLLRRAGPSASPGGRRWHFVPAAVAALVALGIIFWIARIPVGPVGTLPAASQDGVDALIERLGHESLEEREKAMARLLELGPSAEAAIRKAITNKDPEIATRAGQIVAIFDREKRFGQYTKSRQLQERIDRLLRENPGKALLVTRVLERRNGELKPLKSPDFSIGLDVNGTEIQIGGQRGRSSETIFSSPDSDGYLVFTVPQGKCSVHGLNPYRSRIGEGYLVWGHGPATYEVREVHVLPDMNYVPRLKWISPVSGAAVSIKGNAAISWEEMPGVVRASIALFYVEKQAGGAEVYLDAARVDVDCSKDRTLPLADLLKASKIELRAGNEVGLRITGFGANGSVMSENRDLWRFVLEP